MPIQTQAVWLPKRGHADGEYEDAFAGNARAGRFAVADGATESSFAGLWAKLLVERFVEAPLQRAEYWPRWVRPVQKQWARAMAGRDLPWYAAEKLRQGAFATFLGLRLGRSHWRAIAVGDSCLFQLRGGNLVRSFPIERSASFGNTPALVGSRTVLPALPKGAAQAEGTWQPKDQFLLMTDALAQWFLTQVESKQKPSVVVERLLSRAADKKAWAEWLDQLRDKDGLRNDDVTLLVVSL